ncbi:MAG TPA: cob(I)yrinic acid a,c-diamide adenosyltransferase [Cryomorphaceae bacterium]|nr:MAG: cob(I)yrinic acid a c-diamide adenosyltransferase [Cryomorphaceae bacterium BACL7 MAG-120910-bin2]KRO69203.1 MAG: cob(I)yrinic acid a c-diamide adenosyltransferase [Cryomorphaceae bacterium BACL7 MAG-120322-bin74]KRO83921.1 MAG: cob(I)yrinic acid a c-diamide adenosyltransferase [Cryomorphaceae bacterium BACL7 MAG-121220-bin83]NQW24948.1 cob(I)yrinic acid a,c-diamide adenosyltransferase [Cryomorphaceae bacterium]HAB31226.1 cob(I)yrinic acid a,c-diamide adenosyltransferase [Cryomorphaceae
MKIYTKTGDSGQTGLFSGQRVSKFDLRLHAYGTLDELNAHTGLLHDLAPRELQKELQVIQRQLFAIGSHLANDSLEMVERLPPLNPAWTENLEAAIDRMDAVLPPLRNFVLPGGHPAVSHAHLARTVCRRAERWCAELQLQLASGPLPMPEAVLPFLNRLSDYFFTCSRWLAHELGVQEIAWKPEP